MYAEDIVLIAGSHAKMQKLPEIWIEEIENLRMEINTQKSKVIIIKNTKLKEEEAESNNLYKTQISVTVMEQ